MYIYMYVLLSLLIYKLVPWSTEISSSLGGCHTLLYISIAMLDGRLRLWWEHIFGVRMCHVLGFLRWRRMQGMVWPAKIYRGGKSLLSKLWQLCFPVPLQPSYFQSQVGFLTRYNDCCRYYWTMIPYKPPLKACLSWNFVILCICYRRPF